MGKLTQVQVDKILELYKSRKCSVSDLANFYSKGQTTITKLLKDHGVLRPKQNNFKQVYGKHTIPRIFGEVQPRATQRAVA